MNLGLIEVDQNERIVLANNSFSDISGFSSKELIGKKATSLL
jgi:PAS domain S-box-containing protein